jgi:hypothetical protein
MKDGLPISKSPLYMPPTNNVEVVANRDERLNATIMKRGDDYTLGKFGVAGLSFNKIGYCPRKFCNSMDYSSAASHIDFPIIRYAEVLLTYAEAKYELSESISDADLESTINLLRSRAGITPLTNAFVTANDLNMREEIRRERRVELAIEGFPYWDLIRWKTAEIELPKAVLGSYFFEEFGTSVTTILTPDNIILTQQADTRRFRVDRDYLWPFPVNELALNPALKQNPNW